MLKNIILFILIFLSLSTFSQEKKKKESALKPGVEMNPKERFKMEQSREDFKKNQAPNGKPKGPGSQSSKSNSRNRKRKTSSGNLVINHSEKEDKTFSYENNSSVRIKTKKDGLIKGNIEKISEKSIVINGEEIEKRDVLWTNKSSKYKLIQSLKGTGQFIGGLVATGGGLILGTYAIDVIRLGGPFVILGAAGVVGVLAIDIFGLGVAGEGVTMIIEKTKYRIGKKWKFK